MILFRAPSFAETALVISLLLHILRLAFAERLAFLEHVREERHHDREDGGCDDRHRERQQGELDDFFIFSPSKGILGET